MVVNSLARFGLTMVAASIALAPLLIDGTAALARDREKDVQAKSTPAKNTSAAKDAPAAKQAAPAEKTIELGDHIAQVVLPGDYRFADEEAAVKFMKSEGSSGEGVLGLIAPPKGSADRFFIVCRFEPVGYVKDDDADKLNADEILQSYKDGTAEQNEERKAQNLEPIYVGAWAEKPYYDKALHHVVWAIEVKDVDSPSAPAVSINYNTRVLGRRGVLSLNLVTDPKDLQNDKVKVNAILKKTSFIKGNTYAEYIPGTDKAAGYGLAGLILGGGAMAAAAKFGVFGALWKWGLGILLVLKKFLIVGIAAVGALISKFFKKKGPAGGAAESGTMPGTDSDLTGDGK